MPTIIFKSDKEIGAKVVSQFCGIVDQIAYAIAEERERCAKIADHYAQANLQGSFSDGARCVAAYIRSGEP